mgnify:CR=1 FL=1|tara:strand:+ start:719 stop:2014 length:1296 start_codon:yes stop_codon:yes gene_type:complete
MKRRFNTVNEWLEWQQTIHPLNIDFKLERILNVYKRLNISKVAKKVITVAGTNGKGSTVSFLESVLKNNNFKVGAFTSPHILNYNERIKINGKEAGDDLLLDAFEHIDEKRGEITLTYFEFATLSAFYIFSQLDLDVAVLEVGLGGRLDATNIIDSDISIITSISIDHTEFLGNTIDSIALEKAGVMRSFKKSIFAQEKPPAVLYQYAKNKSVNLLVHNNDYNVSRYPNSWSISSKNLSIEEIPNLRMIGDYQYNYAAASILALQEIFPECLTNKNILKKSISQTQIAGRFQYLQNSPDIIVDVAHNEDAAKALLKNIKDKGYKEISVVLGILNDKDVYSIVEPFTSVVNNWFIGTINSERGMNAEEIKYRIKSLFKNTLNIKTYNSIYSAFNDARNHQTSDSLILVYGSFYTVSEVLKNKTSICNEKNAI